MSGQDDMSPGVAVRLEPWGEGDLPLLKTTLGDPEMTKYVGGPEDDEKLAERQVRFEQLADSGTGRMFKILDVATSEAVGSVGYWDRTWRRDEVYEIGWFVNAEFQGPRHRERRDRSSNRPRQVRTQASVPARLPVDRQCAVERDLPKAGIHASGGARVRVPPGQFHPLQ